MRPLCINHGCVSPVASNGARWRVHCTRCQKASYGARTHASGVRPYKTGRCSNSDGHLGFVCGIDYDRAPWAVGITEVDHKDGNHTNNHSSNLDELCPLCHKRKGMLHGDYVGFRYAA